MKKTTFYKKMDDIRRVAVNAMSNEKLSNAMAARINKPLEGDAESQDKTYKSIIKRRKDKRIQKIREESFKRDHKYPSNGIGVGI
jgi:hypothetical protein